MGGLISIVSKEDCVVDVFYCTDYHSHLGTRRGGLAFFNDDEINLKIRDISNSPFRTKFKEDIKDFKGDKGIGIISDYDDQPIIISSHLGKFAIATVGKINNLDSLVAEVLKKKNHFAATVNSEISPTELAGALISQGETFEQGIEYFQDKIDGSCSLLLLTEKGLYAARDKFGRTPLVIGKKQGSFAVASETSSFHNLDFDIEHFLGPGEIDFITPEGFEQRKAPGDNLKICSFLWVYYGFPASDYEDINVGIVRERCGAMLAKRDKNDTLLIDFIAAVPDSGTYHAIGYANESGRPFKIPFPKYSETWARSFMPQEQDDRNLVAGKKLIPIIKMTKDKKMVISEDSIVRATQLYYFVKKVYAAGAKEIHIRVACPPILYPCKYLNFSRSRSENELITRRTALQIEGKEINDFTEFSKHETIKYHMMVEDIKEKLGLTSLKYQKLDDMVTAIGLPKEKLCTYCWDKQG